MRWDLSKVFTNDQALQTFKQQLEHKTCTFKETYKDKLHTLAPKTFTEALEEYEQLLESIARVMSYAYLKFAADTTQGAFYAECELQTNTYMENLIFFDIEFSRLPEEIAQSFMEVTPHYRYYLELVRQNQKHLRSIEEEAIMLKLSPMGSNAFSRLFSEHFSRLRFKIKKDKYTEEEILAKLYHPERAIRKEAATSLSKTLKRELPLLGYILNAIKKELAIMQDIRHYGSPEESRHIDNQTTQKSVDAMIDVVNENMGMVATFYHSKRKILGYKKLYDYDRYAPLFENQATFDFDTSQKLVLESLKDFSPIFHQIAKRAFEEKWIDSHPRENKQGGAFSHPTVPLAHPYVLLNHTDNRRDVFTMAHELGHAIHQELSKEKGYLNSDTPLTTSETASVFAEMLLFEHIKQKLQGKEKLALYANKLEDIFATLFRQTVFTNFERRIHSRTEEISTEEISMLWLEENQKMFGNSVILSANYSLWWSYIPHFIHSPFYCYAYSYGQLLVMALFGVYRREKEQFIDTYIQFLKAGGSRPPSELVGLFGFDIESKDFWEIGISEINILLSDFLKTLKDLKG